MKKQVVFHIVIFIGLVANAQHTEVEKLNNSGIDKITTPAQAEQIFRKATAIDTTYAKAPYNLGTALFQENHVEEAFGHLKEAANRSKQPELSHKAFHNIGNIYMQKKEYDNAVEAYKQALRNDPADEETRYNLALAKKKKQEEEQKQDQNQDQDQDQDQQENEENKENDQEDKEGNQENEGDQGDSKEKEKESEKESENEKGDGSEKKDQKKGQGDQKQEQGKQPENKQSQGSPKLQELSKQQIENLLQALQNEENKVQEKMNAKKVQGRKLKVEKDW